MGAFAKISTPASATSATRNSLLAIDDVKCGLEAVRALRPPSLAPVLNAFARLLNPIMATESRTPPVTRAGSSGIADRRRASARQARFNSPEVSSLLGYDSQT